MASDEERREGLVLRVPRRDAETARAVLSAVQLLARGRAPEPAGEDVLLPLVEEPDEATLRASLPMRPGWRLVTAALRVRDVPLGDYRALLSDLGEETRVLLPRAHDVVGDIAVVRIPDALDDHVARIGAAILASRPGVRSVARDRGVQGPFRVRDLELIAGEERLATVHREHGVALEVDLERTYFSPRLATERERVLRRIAPRGRVLDLFAGIGALVVRLARERDPAALCAIDWNPDATRLLARNLERNKVAPGRVDVRSGDAREVAPRTADWDHVVMNLPHESHRFLDVAAECVAESGEVHLYAMVERREAARHVEEVAGRLGALTGRDWALVERRHVRDYSPTIEGLGLSFKSTRDG